MLRVPQNMTFQGPWHSAVSERGTANITWTWYCSELEVQDDTALQTNQDSSHCETTETSSPRCSQALCLPLPSFLTAHLRSTEKTHDCFWNICFCPLFCCLQDPKPGQRAPYLLLSEQSCPLRTGQRPWAPDRALWRWTSRDCSAAHEHPTALVETEKVQPQKQSCSQSYLKSLRFSLAELKDSDRLNFFFNHSGLA